MKWGWLDGWTCEYKKRVQPFFYIDHKWSSFIFFFCSFLLLFEFPTFFLFPPSSSYCCYHWSQKVPWESFLTSFMTLRKLFIAQPLFLTYEMLLTISTNKRRQLRSHMAHFFIKIMIIFLCPFSAPNSSLLPLICVVYILPKSIYFPTNNVKCKKCWKMTFLT